MTTNAVPAALDLSGLRGSHLPLPCDSIPPMLDFFVQRLGWRIDAIFPADSPRHAILSGHGISLALYVGEGARPDVIRLLCDDPDAVAGGQRELVAPNGVTVRFVHANPPMVLPPTRQALVFSRMDEGEAWVVGRAGLRYRDLLPDRHGGAFIASHIRILEGGPVPDYVHYHKVRFQMIFCRKGWVRVAYEGLAAPILMQAGDCVLQPPEIRHRVLESSAGAEVVELASPAQHITIADHDMPLPGVVLPADHDFHGQRFVFSEVKDAAWSPWRVPGFEVRDTGIGAATFGLAGARVVRATGPGPAWEQTHRGSELVFYFVLQGRLTLSTGGQVHTLAADDSVTLPEGRTYQLTPSADLEMLEVTLPEKPTSDCAPA